NMLRYLILMTVLILGACAEKKTSAQTSEVADKPEIITPEERASIIAGLEKGDYTVLDRFFTTNELFPEFIVKDSDIREWYCDLTNKISFQNKGTVISYTNRYGISFLNSDELVLTEDELTNTLIQQSKSFGQIHTLASCIIETNIESITNILDEDVYDGGSTILYIKAEFILHELLNLDQKERKLLDIYSPENRDKLIAYYHSRILPKNLVQEKIVWINYIAYLMFRPMDDSHPFLSLLIYNGVG
ncbi:MAG: hypothetical protein ACRCS8_05090, partial [Brevinema sp.]